MLVYIVVVCCLMWWCVAPINIITVLVWCYYVMSMIYFGILLIF